MVKFAVQYRELKEGLNLGLTMFLQVSLEPVTVVKKFHVALIYQKGGKEMKYTGIRKKAKKNLMALG